MNNETTVTRLIREFDDDEWIGGTKQWCAEAVSEMHRLTAQVAAHMQQIQEMRNKCPSQMLHEIAEPVGWPTNARAVREFMASNCRSQVFANADETPSADDRYQLTAHDFLEAIDRWKKPLTGGRRDDTMANLSAREKSLLTAILAGEELQHFDIYKQWNDVIPHEALNFIATGYHHRLRVKPKFIDINGVLVIAPLSVPPKMLEQYWVARLKCGRPKMAVWTGDGCDFSLLELGLCYATEAGAAARIAAFLSFYDAGKKCP